MLSLIQWNCRSLNAQFDDILHLMSEHSPDIICLSETRASVQFTPNFVNYISLLSNDDSKFGGSMILLNKNLNFSPVQLRIQDKALRLHFDIVGVLLNPTSNSKLAIFSIYCPPRHNHPDLPLVFWQELFDELQNFPKCLVVGDFNAHHPLWTADINKTPDLIGLRIERAISAHQFVCLNDGSPTWFSVERGISSSIDLSFASSNIALSISWETFTLPLGSDHFPIKIIIDGFRFEPVPCRPSISLGKTDWKLFTETMGAALSEVSLINISGTDIYDKFYKLLIESLLSAGSYYRKASTFKNNFPTVWWDENCAELIKEKRSVAKKFYKHPTRENYLQMKLTSVEVKRDLKRIKRESFIKFCSSLHRSSDIAWIWKMIGCFKSRAFNVRNPRSVGSLQDASSFFIRTVAEDPIVLQGKTVGSTDLKFNTYADYMGHTLDDLLSSNIIDLLDKCTFASLSLVERDSLLRPFSFKEFESALISSKSNAAAGPDCISMKVLQKLDLPSQTTLLKIFNKIFNYSSYPLSWKHYYMLLIPKNGPGLRPISLASSCMKLFERLISYRLDWWIEKRNILDDNQFGFRKSRSCADNIFMFSFETKVALSKGLSVVAAFIDIKGAFDNVNTLTLISILKKLNLPDKICAFIFHSLTDRKISGYYGGNTLGDRYTSKGVPQGSALSPFLFNIYTALILKVLSGHCRGLMYADDLVIYASGKDIQPLFSIIQENIDNISHLLESLDLSISTAKSYICPFSNLRVGNLRRLIESTGCSISLQNSNISIVYEVKFLGITFDSNFLFRTQSKILDISMKKRLNILRAISGMSWGAHPSLLLSIYKAIIRSCMDYAFICILDMDERAITALNRVQYAGLRSVMGLLKSTPTNVILHMAGELTVRDRSVMLFKRYISKVLSMLYHPAGQLVTSLINSVNPSNSSLFFKIIRDVKLRFSDDLLLMNYPTGLECSPRARFMDVGVDLDSGGAIAERCSKGLCCRSFPELRVGSGWSLSPWVSPKNEISSADIIFSDLFKIYAGYNLIFTDGSRSEDGGAGYACFYDFNNKFFLQRASSFLTIFDLEALAIISALEGLFSMPPDRFMILSDSKSALKSIVSPESGRCKSFLIYRIKDLTSNLMVKGFVINFAWLPGHVGIRGNDIADFLAVKAASMSDDESSRKFFANNLRTVFRKEAIDSTLVSLFARSATVGFHYFNRTKRKLDMPWFIRNTNLSRSFITTICRLRANHTRCKAHLYVRNMADSPNCTCGDYIQTPQHLFFDCINNTQASDVLRTGLERLSLNCSLTDIVFSNSEDIFSLLESFIMKTSIVI